MVKQLRLFRLGRRIIHFFSLAAADNQLGARQLPKRMRYRRLLMPTMAERLMTHSSPWQRSQKGAAAPIAQLLQKNRYGLGKSSALGMFSSLRSIFWL